MRPCAIITCKRSAYGRWCKTHRKTVQRRMRWRQVQRAHRPRLVKLMPR